MSSAGALSVGGASAGSAGAPNGGGTAGSAGTSVGGSAGAGVGGQPADPCATALFCDDFESYAIGQAPSGSWTSQLNAGQIQVDGSEHASGAKSVMFTTQSKAGSKTALLRLAASSVFPVAGNMFFGRMLFRLEAAPTASVHWTLIQGGGLVPGQNYHSLYRYGGQLPITQNNTFVGSQLMANYDTPDSYSGTGPASDCYKHANGTVVPVAKWSCVEWQFDGPHNSMHLWLDGAPLTDLTLNGTGQGCINQSASYVWSAPNFDHIDVGWESYQTDTERTLWIDDVVISKVPIGCPP